MGPQLNLAFLSTSQVCLVMDRTHAPIFSPFSIWSVGFGKDVEALYSPEGRVLLLIFMINIQFQSKPKFQVFYFHLFSSSSNFSKFFFL